MNYESRLGTDWSEIAFDEALLRAFALGLALEADSAPVGEADRLFEVATSGYERRLLEMAIEEGRRFEADREAAGKPTRSPPPFIARLDVDIDELIEAEAADISTIPPLLRPVPRNRSPPGSHDLSLPSLLRRPRR